MSHNRRKLKGKKFGRLRVLAATKERQGGHVVWKCRCLCEARTIVYTHTSNLTRGNTLSCGCWQKEVSRRPTEERESYVTDNTPD